MKARFLALLVVSVLSAPAYAGPPTDLLAVAVTVHQNFAYRAQRGDDATFHTGEERFYGDCDDFALAASFQLWRIGYEPELVFLDARRSKHVIVCADGWCIDNERPKPYREGRIRRTYTVIARMPVDANRGVLQQFERLAAR